jgi:hypothetical protein
MRNRTQRTHDELRPEYNFDYSKAIRGKYYPRLLKQRTNVVVLEPDIAKVFRDSAKVNDTLRVVLEFTRSTRRLTKRSSGNAKKNEATHSI